MKKFFVFMTAAVIAASALLLPASAETPTDLEGNVIASMDYRTKSTSDLIGNYFFVEPKPEKGPVTFVEYDGVTCVDRNGSSSSNEGFRYIHNDGHYQSLNEVFTLETYVYMTDELNGFPVTIWWGGDGSFSAFGWTGYEFGFGRHDPDTALRADKRVVESEDRELVDGWYHLVAASDGETLKIYVNGEEKGSGVYNQKNGMPGLHNFYTMYTEIEGYAMAYLKVYNVAATPEQVAEMAGKEVPSESPSASTEPTPSESASPSASTEPTPSESASPSASTEPTPSESVDPSESTSPSSGSSATAVPTKAPDQSNAKTFDMGLVSFAAVALSSLVAVKKRK